MTSDFQRDRDLAEKIFVAKITVGTISDHLKNDLTLQQMELCFHYARLWRAFDAEMCRKHEEEKKHGA